MKKLMLLVLISISVNSFAQNAKVDNKGNYVAVKTVTAIGDTTNKTGKTFTDSKGVRYSVYLSKNNKPFYIRTSKTGNRYKVYIKL